MKVLLVPLAILSFVVFLLVLGAVGLAVAMTTIWLLGRVARLLAWPGRRLRRARRMRAAAQ